MGCMKCGRDTQEGQVFCENCLDIMHWYPVKPGTAVQLPSRRESPVRKISKRRGPTPEEQIKSLRKQVRGLIIALILTLIMIGAMAFPTYEHLMEEGFDIGQNYTAIIPTQTTEASGG